jgi:hypothetical protein
LLSSFFSSDSASDNALSDANQSLYICNRVAAASSSSVSSWSKIACLSACSCLTAAVWSFLYWLSCSPRAVIDAICSSISSISVLWLSKTPCINAS